MRKNGARSENYISLGWKLCGPLIRSFIKISIPGSRENSEPGKNPPFPPPESSLVEYVGPISRLVEKEKAPVVICKEVKTANEGHPLHAWNQNAVLIVASTLLRKIRYNNFSQKIMAFVFWDHKDIIFFKDIPRRAMLTERVFLLHETSKLHKVNIRLLGLFELRLKYKYSVSDYWFYPYMNISIKKHRQLANGLRDSSPTYGMWLTRKRGKVDYFFI